MNHCVTCKHWGEAVERPWAGPVAIAGHSPTRSERRNLEMADERDCLRIGGFSGAGGTGEHPKFVDGDHMPRTEAYVMAYSGGVLTTCPYFGCSLWESK